MSVAAWSGALLRWDEELAAFKSRLSAVFGRSEVRYSAGAFIDGSLSGVSRKTGWQLAEQAGLAAPYRIQSLLGRSSWDADALRDLVRGEVLESLGDAAGVLVVDETGFLKKGRHSVGVARQYSGTAGRVENCQVGVFLGYASRFGQALIDRRLYLPESWAADGERRRKASVPQAVAFATKPQIAAEMIAARSMPASVRPSCWPTRCMASALPSAACWKRGAAYVLATRSNHTLRFFENGRWIQTDPATLADGCRLRPGPPIPPGKAAKGSGFTNGRGWRCLGAQRMVLNAGCCSAAAGTIQKISLITWPLQRPAHRSQIWPAPPAYAGRSKNASSAPRKSLVLITARPAPGTAGTAT